MKSFFLSRLLREKLLLSGLTLFAALMWLSGVSTRAMAFSRQFKSTSLELKNQTMMLNEQPRIEANAAAAIQNLDPSHTFNVLRLQEELYKIAQTTGITTSSSGDPKVEPTTQFTVNTVQFSIRNADYGSLVRFYLELVKRSPYIGIEQISIAANRANNSQLSASLKVSSIEITP